jgi:two-component system chemotaxis response regulator CheY
MPIAIGLVVDDQPDIRRLFVRALLRGGIEAIEARSGVEALALARGTVFDFVVTDVEMPDMNGVELCRQLRQLNVAPTIPIVVVTGAPSQADDATAAGCTVVLAKPCPPKLLLTTIQQLLIRQITSAAKP